MFEAIYRRRSIRRFVPGAQIPKQVVDKILETVIYVPSPAPLFSVFPWRYILMYDSKSREMLGSFGRETARVLFGVVEEIFRGHLWYIPEEEVKLRVHAESATGEIWNYPATASFVVLPCYARGAWGARDNPLLIIPVPEICSATLGMTCQNMWLAATAMDLACALNAMPTNDPRRREMVADLLGIPHSWEFLGAFSFGIPAQRRYVGPSRAPLEGIVFEEAWGNNYVRLGFRQDHPQIEDPPKLDLFQAISSQKQVAEFTGEKVEDWKIEKILDAARWAPNPENLQHWRYVMVRRDSQLKQMLYEWNMEHANMLKTLGLVKGAEAIAKMLTEILSFPKQADTVIFPCYTRSCWVEYPMGAGSMADYIFAGATGHALQNMWLAAIALGLGATYDILPVIDNRRKELLKDYLGIPPSWEPLGAFYLGYPERYLPYMGRPRKSELFFLDHWGARYELGA